MTIDEAICHCLDVVENNNKFASENPEAKRKCEECSTDHQQLANWLIELKDLRAEQNDQYLFIRDLMDELKEAKRLLKISLDDIETALTEEKCKVCGLDYCGVDTICKWRYADEVRKFFE